MTNLSDFLKCKKVRCVDDDGCNDLTIGKEYEVTRLSLAVHIIDDDDGEYSYQARRFEPVIDELSKSAENPLQDMKLTPEFEAPEPTFKVGDKVYTGIDEDIKVIKQVKEKFVVAPSIPFLDTHYPISEVCHATSENHEMLCKLYPHIKFEQPPKPLTGSDLARAMLDKGWNLVPCVISQISDDEALLNDDVVFIDEWNGRQFEHGDKFCIFAVPFDPKTGEPLTESILND